MIIKTSREYFKSLSSDMSKKAWATRMRGQEFMRNEKQKQMVSSFDGRLVARCDQRWSHYQVWVKKSKLRDGLFIERPIRFFRGARV